MCVVCTPRVSPKTGSCVDCVATSKVQQAVMKFSAIPLQTYPRFVFLLFGTRVVHTKKDEGVLSNHICVLCCRLEQTGSGLRTTQRY